MIIGIYKPKGITSHDVVDKVRRITGIKQVGHAGTLDPLAKGVLVIGIGKSTKQLNQIVAKEKEYLAEIFLGEFSKTDDAEGERKKIEFDIPNLKDIKKTVLSFQGEIMQKPPQYSAIKVSGVPAYKLARKGIRVELKPRKVLIKEIEILDYSFPILKLRVVTGPGTYIRSLARDIGKQLKTGAYLSNLERTRVGEFDIKVCLSLEQIIEYLQDKEIVV